MKSHFILILGAFLLLISVVVNVQAQNSEEQQVNTRFAYSEEITNLKADREYDVKIVDFRLRKINNNRVEEFTIIDLLKVEKFLLGYNSVLACESNSLDKTVQAITKNGSSGNDHFPHKEVANELAKLGFVVTHLKSGVSKLTFEGNGSCKEPYHENSELNLKLNDCDNCGEAKVSQESLEKFQNEQYGGSLINFDLDTIHKP